MVKGQILDKIYHGYAKRYSNGKRKLIDFENGERCLIPTSHPFWSNEIPTGCCLQTRSSTKQRELAKGPFKVLNKQIYKQLFFN